MSDYYYYRFSFYCKKEFVVLILKFQFVLDDPVSKVGKDTIVHAISI